MPAKTPIYLKTATPKRGQKLRLRDVLSSDMISPPLGDFRHSAHIGLDGEGDMFGELSFLQGRYDVLPRLLSRRQGGPPGPEPPRRALLKTAVSLPAFSGGGVPGSEQAPPKPPRLHLEEAPPGGGGGGGGGGGRKPLQHSQQQHPQHPPQQQQRSMSVSCAEGCFHHAQAGGGLSFSARGYDPLPSSVSFSSAGPPPPEGTFAGGPPLSPELPRSESLLQLDLDLGPSILDDVLRIMEEYQRPQGPVASPPLGSPCP